ncbi:hypothetical protein COS51_05030 [Candidatus Roizmanbacteria bacterium CG03_land_8_20_14_0_80_36_21]|nr:MAG: hypothetical protein COS51_05030 [Candidatus Roizmanbacteria bacterium CG03_land_8_20_14_0_80_36_21]
MDDGKNPTQIKAIKLSKYTHALLGSLNSIKPKTRPDDLSKISVSQTVSFFALAYEKVRNAVEYREDHQIRRAAIERIMRRLLTLNPTGKDVADGLIRELLWARYFDADSLGSQDIDSIQKIIDKYIFLLQLLIVGRTGSQREFLYRFLIDLLTCEIEENLNPSGSQKNANYTFFIYQVLRNKIKLEGVSEDQKNAFFLAALERTFRRSDRSYQRYHLFITFYQPISSFSTEELKDFSNKLPIIFDKIDLMVKNPFVDHLSRFIKKQLPAFLILFSIIKDKYAHIEKIISNKKELWSEVELTCRQKYQGIKAKMTGLAIRSFIYIFFTKMLFALILEFPLSKYFYGEVNYESIVINTLFPPALMLFIIAFFTMPGADNTTKIFQRIVEIIDADRSFETSIAFVRKKPRERKPILIFGFTIFYSLTFIITLFLIFEILNLLNFNLISQAIFLFFISVVTFFSYRIKQIVNEYYLSEKESILSPLFDFFFMPILSLGKFFSQEIAKLNFFIFIFDFLIEAPFKFIFEIVEEWISFVKKRKEEII